MHTLHNHIKGFVEAFKFLSKVILDLFLLLSIITVCRAVYRNQKKAVAIAPCWFPSCGHTYKSR
jgi:hypothetical protein